MNDVVDLGTRRKKRSGKLTEFERSMHETRLLNDRTTKSEVVDLAAVWTVRQVARNLPGTALVRLASSMLLAGATAEEIRAEVNEYARWLVGTQDHGAA